MLHPVRRSSGKSGNRFSPHHREHPKRTRRPGQIPTHLGFTQAISGPRLVPQCEVRHLGALGAAMPAGGRRLVRPEHVPGRVEANINSISRTTAIRRSSASRTSSTYGKPRSGTPIKLVSFYKRVGAQYFFALANHHDNLDLWDSKYQPWNSVNVGPKKDLIAGWAKAARDNGLPFGVSVHAAHAWSWYEVAQGADKAGDRAGVPYDGKLTKADGKGLVVGWPRSAGPLRAEPRAKPGFPESIQDSLALELGQRRHPARSGVLRQVLQSHR